MKWPGCFVFLAPLWMMAEPAAPPDPGDAAYPAIERLVNVMESVRERHPDVDLLTYERLVNHALEGMMQSLDPFSSFIHPEMAALMKADSKVDPEIPSLGMSAGLRDSGWYVMAVSPHGPAAKAGILAGSSILEVDGLKVDGSEAGDFYAAFKKAAGDQTTLKLKSADEPSPVEISLTHRFVDSRSVAESRIISPETGAGYLRLAVFGGGCAKEMEVALDDLEDAGMKSLILDLRGNGGGSLDETVKILGLFLPPGTKVVTTRSRSGDEPPLATGDRQRRKREYPMVVLVDRMSASASELTAGALQDLKRAKVVGETSFGKGSVQQVVQLGGGTAMRLTIATYHTPSGETPHLKGIVPDVLIDIQESDREDFEKRCRLDSLDAAERERLEKSPDRVLKAALNTLGG